MATPRLGCDCFGWCDPADTQVFVNRAAHAELGPWHAYAGAVYGERSVLPAVDMSTFGVIFMPAAGGTNVPFDTSCAENRHGRCADAPKAGGSPCSKSGWLAEAAPPPPPPATPFSSWITAWSDHSGLAERMYNRSMLRAPWPWDDTAAHAAGLEPAGHRESWGNVLESGDLYSILNVGSGAGRSKMLYRSAGPALLRPAANGTWVEVLRRASSLEGRDGPAAPVPCRPYAL